MVTVETNSVTPKGYVGRHIKDRPKRFRLIRRLRDRLFGKIDHGATVSQMRKVPEKAVAPRYYSMAAIINELDVKAQQFADEMKPWISELDAIMERFRTGLAGVQCA